MMTEMIASQRGARESPFSLVYVQNTDVLGDYMDSSLKNIEAIFLDLDGTIYLGGELIPGALEFSSDVTSMALNDSFFLIIPVVLFLNI